jgi:Nickel responsive protein SCO4226-like
MKKFVVERNFPGAVNLSPEELQDISQTSCEAIVKLGKPYHWVHSYITGDKIYCIHIAESEEVIRQHASLGKFPINTVSEVKTIIDPSTSNCL